MLMTMSTTISKMATQIATFRRGPTRTTRQFREKLLAPGKLELQYLQVRA
jgi:hypothetical protein